jgi:hypothetical protein
MSGTAVQGLLSWVSCVTALPAATPAPRLLLGEISMSRKELEQIQIVHGPDSVPNTSGDILTVCAYNEVLVKVTLTVQSLRGLRRLMEQTGCDAGTVARLAVQCASHDDIEDAEIIVMADSLIYRCIRKALESK